MKKIGILRKIDTLGRIVIPKEIRNALSITDDDPLEIFQEGDRIVIQKHCARCIFCGGNDTVTEYKGKLVCKDCIKELADMA